MSSKTNNTNTRSSAAASTNQSSAVASTNQSSAVASTNQSSAVATSASSSTANNQLTTISNLTSFPADPIFLDEVHFPLKNVYVTVNGTQTDGVAKELQKLDVSGYFKLIKLGETKDGGIGLTTTQICHDTIDMRDSFRVFVDASDVSKKYALNCYNALPTSSNIKAKKVEKAKCDANIHSYYTDEDKLDTDVTNVYSYLYRSTFDRFGNLIVSPPSTPNPYGTILIGSQTANCINKFIGTNANALTFSWRPFCERLNDTNKLDNTNAGLNTQLKSLRQTYCANEQSFDFSNPLKRGNEKVDGISDDFSSILQKFRKQKTIEIFTGWLEVGHIDEIVSFIPFPKEESTYGFKVLIASPGKFLELWANAKSKNDLKEKCLFNKPLLPKEGGNYGNGLLSQRKLVNAKIKIGIPFKSVDCQIKIEDYDTDAIRPLREFNQWIQDAILTKIKQQLVTELGLNIEKDFIDIPILYIGPDELFNNIGGNFKWFRETGNLPKTIQNMPATIKSMLGNFGVYHLSNNFINSLYSTTYIVSPKLEDNIGCIDYIKDEIKRDTHINVIFDVIDEWDTVKYQHGGLHCYTTEYRTITDDNKEGIYPYRTANAGGGRKKTRKQQKKQKNRKTRSKKY